MNKKYAKATLIAVVALISGINVFNAQKSESLSDIALANVEALANPEQPNIKDCIEAASDCIALHPTDESLISVNQMHDGRQQIINLNSLLSI